MVRLASLYVATEVFLLVFSGALRGSGDTFFTLLVSTGTHWCLAIALFITLEAFHLSTFAGWRVYVGAFTLCPLLLVLRWKTGRWRTMTSSSLEPFTPRATESVISS
jgi:MATE family multidrug resistance protein